MGISEMIEIWRDKIRWYGMRGEVGIRREREFGDAWHSGEMGIQAVVKTVQFILSVLHLSIIVTPPLSYIRV